MGSYVKNSLSEGERVIYLAHLAIYPYSKRIFLGVFLFLLPKLFQFFPNLPQLPWWVMLFGVAIFGQVYMHLNSVELAITNRRIIVKTGIVQRKTSELYLNRVEGVEVEQSMSERMLGYGTVNIRGVGTEIAPVAHISNPLEFRKQFFDAADNMMGHDAAGGPYPGTVNRGPAKSDESPSR